MLLHARRSGRTSELPKKLEELGAIVDDIACYKTVPETDDRNGAAARLLKDGADWITFASAFRRGKFPRPPQFKPIIDSPSANPTRLHRPRNQQSHRSPWATNPPSKPKSTPSPAWSKPSKEQTMNDNLQNPENHIALFQRKEVRRIIHNNEWWFVITDVVAALTDSANPSGYFKDMRRRDLPLAEALKGGGQFAPPLGLEFDTVGGPQLLQCWNTEGIFRLIQSIPSPKAEPFKRWLARVGYERIQEIEDPELATKRTRALYKAKGYSDDWIEKRMRSIAIRDELTDEWKKRGVKEQREYAILTAEISKPLSASRPANTPSISVSNVRTCATT